MDFDIKPSVLDLFAAPGGMSQGFKEAGYQILGAVDNDRWGCETLRYNFGKDGTKIFFEDIETLEIDGKVDVIIGGPPCQSFSRVGSPKIQHLTKNNIRERLIDDTRNNLYHHFIRIVSLLKPQFYVMENVPGMLSFQNGQIKNQVIEDFHIIGYKSDMQILNAADFGVPQIRKRAFFIGNRVCLENPFPKETHYNPRRAPKNNKGQNELKSYLTIFDAISDLPPLEPGQGTDSMEYIQNISLTEYQSWARAGALKLQNHIARKHSQRDRNIFATLEPGQKMTDLPYSLRPYRSDIFQDKIKKQSWDRPSSAILAHMQKDGLMYVHPDQKQARSFTPREAARLQSFPDKYVFKGPMTQQFKQIGNAVPPLIARHIAQTLRRFIIPLNKPYLEIK